MDSKQQYDVPDSDGDYETDDSQEDPTFDVLEETRSSLSKLSIKIRKSKDMSARRNVSKALEECIDGDKIVPELDEQDQKSYETVQKIIKAGQIEKLKVEQCKVYLRKHGLRLTGSKDILIQRIKEHTDIIDGRGEEKYPPSSFVLNCKGDACTGDVVMFEQNVYEMFSIASRSATGPPCGTRIVAGRIVKESYGAKKQQHTFTVEVLWSKGEKPLPPLHPLLIKGRNLYRLKTLRQKWDDEAERQKILSEKHARGFVARSNREVRVQEKEMRKMRKENRVTKDHKEKREVESKVTMPRPALSREHQNNTVHSNTLSMNSGNEKNQLQGEVDKGQKDKVKDQRNNITVSRENQRQPLTKVNLNDPSFYGERGYGNGILPNPWKSPVRMHNSNTHMPIWRGYSNGGYSHNYNIPSTMHNSNVHMPMWRSPLQGHGYNNNYTQSQRNVHGEARNGWCNAGGGANCGFQVQREEQKRPCRFYAQGRCYYGHTCKYLHVGSVDT